MATVIFIAKTLGFPGTDFAYGAIILMTAGKFVYMFFLNSVALFIANFIFKPNPDFSRTILLGMAFYLVGILSYVFLSDDGILSRHHGVSAFLIFFSPATAAVTLPTIIAYGSIYYFIKTKRFHFLLE